MMHRYVCCVYERVLSWQTNVQKACMYVGILGCCDNHLTATKIRNDVTFRATLSPIKSFLVRRLSILSTHTIYTSNYKQQRTVKTNMPVRGSDILLIIVAILFPPAAAAFITGCSCDLLINIVSFPPYSFCDYYPFDDSEDVNVDKQLLTVLGYIPGHIHAF
jgi:uncharacterized membrane protein YqaE (UPF0057 family)